MRFLFDHLDELAGQDMVQARYRAGRAQPPAQPNASLFAVLLKRLFRFNLYGYRFRP